MGAYLFFDGVELHFDAVVTEQAEHTIAVTDKAVEEGADITDHVRAQPNRVTLEVVVSNTPIRDVNNLYGEETVGVEINTKAERAKATGYSDSPKGPFPVTPGALFAAVGNAVSSLFGDEGPTIATVKKFSAAPFDAVRDTLNTLQDWQDKGILGEVITPHRTYENMIVEHVSTNRDATTGTSARITIELRSIRIVSTASAALATPVEIRANKTKAKGRKPGVTVVDVPKKSLLSGILGR